MNVAAVRKMTGPEMRRVLKQQAVDFHDIQRMTVRCAVCGWYRATVPGYDRERVFNAHLTSKRHERAAG